MNRKGVIYDVGRLMKVNWHAHFDPDVVHWELLVIKNDLHCTAVKIGGLSLTRLMIAAKEALANPPPRQHRSSPPKWHAGIGHTTW